MTEQDRTLLTSLPSSTGSTTISGISSVFSVVEQAEESEETSEPASSPVPLVTSRESSYFCREISTSSYRANISQL